MNIYIYIHTYYYKYMQIRIDIQLFKIFNIYIYTNRKLYHVVKL